MLRVADFIVQTLAKHGISHIFLVTGGASMHLNDAIGRSQDLSYVCCHHEQACAMAAESYYRLTNRLAAVNVSAGPAGTNAITGVYGAWVDSIGMIVISGQVTRKTLTKETNLPLRQLGDQEVDIVSLVTPITKYAVTVTEPDSIRYHLERALHLAQSGRPGPCWVDVPLDVQSTLIDPDSLPGYDPREDTIQYVTPNLSASCQHIIERLKEAQRPVILAGEGIRLVGAYAEFIRLVDAWGIPVVTAWNTPDLLWNEHPCFVGRFGVTGDRAGNFAVQNADFLLALGCHLNMRQVSFAWQHFARAAYKVIVDIDDAELKKPTIQPDFPIHANPAHVLAHLVELNHSEPSQAQRDWLDWCKQRQRNYPVVLSDYWLNQEKINPYCFVQALFKALPEEQIVVMGCGGARMFTAQAAFLKPGQRLYSNSGCASMGYELPAAIGACIGSGGKSVICIAGDGSIQMNLQELQTIVGYNLPIKIFVMNNQGYHSIRQSQKSFYPDNLMGFEPGNGVTLPSFEKLAFAYGIPYQQLDQHSSLSEIIQAVIHQEGTQICEIMLDITQSLAPKVSGRKLDDGRLVSSPLEDMSPPLGQEEFLSNMLIAPVSRD